MKLLVFYCYESFGRDGLSETEREEYGNDRPGNNQKTSCIDNKGGGSDYRKEVHPSFLARVRVYCVFKSQLLLRLLT